MSVSKVSSTLTDFASRSATTGRSSSARASRCSPVPCAWPSRRTSSSAGSRSRSSTVRTPTRRSRSAVAGPTPGMTVDLHRAQQLLLGAGGDHDEPVGLVEVAGDLGDQLGRGDADRAGERRRSPSRTSALRSARRRSVTPSTTRSARWTAARSTNASSSESGSTSGDSSRSAPSPPGWPRGRRRNGRRGRPRAGTAARASRGRHRRAHAVARAPRTTRSPPPRGRRCRRRRPACPQRRLVALLDRGEEGVEVEVEDRGVGSHRPIMTVTRAGLVHRHRPPRQAPSTAGRRRPRPGCRCGSAAAVADHDRDDPRLRATRSPTCSPTSPVVLGLPPERLARGDRPSATARAGRSTRGSTCPPPEDGRSASSPPSLTGGGRAPGRRGGRRGRLRPRPRPRRGA